MRYDWAAMLTDYGRRDGFVAACHGVLARLAPHARVIDISHDVPAQDVRHGAAVLAQTLTYLPPRLVVVAVVDPGVGTARRSIAVTAGEAVLIGPDNGLLGWAADALGGATGAVSLVAREYHLPEQAGTFDGRDVYAPVAAHVCSGTPVADLGEPVAVDGTDAAMIRLPEPRVAVRAAELEAEVLTIDHFGNVQLAARRADLEAADLPSDVRIHGGSRLHTPMAARYGSVFADAEPGDAVLYVDSAGHVAVAVNRASAAAALDIRPGEIITVRPSS